MHRSGLQSSFLEKTSLFPNQGGPQMGSSPNFGSFSDTFALVRGPEQGLWLRELSILSYTSTLTYQNLLCCRVPINSILGFIIRTYKKAGFTRSIIKVMLFCWDLSQPCGRIIWGGLNN